MSCHTVPAVGIFKNNPSRVEDYFTTVQIRVIRELIRVIGHNKKIYYIEISIYLCFTLKQKRCTLVLVL